MEPLNIGKIPTCAGRNNNLKTNLKPLARDITISTLTEEKRFITLTDQVGSGNNNADQADNGGDHRENEDASLPTRVALSLRHRKTRKIKRLNRLRQLRDVRTHTTLRPDFIPSGSSC